MFFSKINSEVEAIRGSFSMELVSELREIHSERNYKAEMIKKMFRK